jgi:CelD/BcsL family acetyltransferase involved in cellulose biosynthesis
MNWRFDWIEGGESNAPLELRRRWDAAFESHGDIWQYRGFFRCWDETMAAAHNQRPILSLASDCAGRQVIYPLYAQRRSMWGAPFTTVEPMGGAFYCDYQDPLPIGERMREEDWQSYWAGLRGSLPRRFGRLSELRVYRLTNLSGAVGGGLKVSTVSPFIPLDGVTDLQALLADRGRNLRERVGRLLRRARDRGGYALRRVSSDSIPEAIGQFCQCYAEQWGQEGRPHVMQNPETRLYWSALAAAANASGKLHFSVFEVDGEPWHWHFGLEHRGVLLWYKMTYHVRFSQLSPGMLHLALLVEDGIARGMRCVDLGCGAEDYKFKWTDSSQELFSGRAGSLTPLAEAAKRAVRGGRALRGYLSNLRRNNGGASVEARSFSDVGTECGGLPYGRGAGGV